MTTVWGKHNFRSRALAGLQPKVAYMRLRTPEMLILATVRCACCRRIACTRDRALMIVIGSAACMWQTPHDKINRTAVPRGQKSGQSPFRGGLDFAGLSRPHPSATYGLLPGGPLSLLTLLYLLPSLMPETGTCATNILDAGAACARALGCPRPQLHNSGPLL